MNNKKQVLKGLLVFIVYMSLQFFQTLPLDLLKIDINNMSFFAKLLYLSIYEIIFFIIIVSFYIKDLKKDFKDLKKNHKKYFKEYIKYWFIMLGLMVCANLITNIINPGNIASNEEAIRNNLFKAPIYTFLSATLFAPVVEELVFRKSFRNMFSNKILFIFLSGFVFGGIHVFTNLESVSELLFLLSYCTPGFVLAYTYEKSKNIFVPMGIHFIHNGILMSLQILIFLLS